MWEMCDDYTSYFSHLKHFDYMFCWVFNIHTYMIEYIKTIYKN